MGQPFPQLPNGQFPQGLPPALPQANSLNPAQLAAMANSMQGMDPRMVAQAQQEIANPNQGDLLSAIIPGPKQLALGAAAGSVTAMGLAALMGEGHDGPLPATAKWLDDTPWIRKFTDWAEQRYQKLTNGGLKEGLITVASKVPKNSTDWEQYARDAVAKMEERHIQKVMEKFPNRFNDKNDKLKSAYEKQYLHVQKQQMIAAYNSHVEKNFEFKAKGVSKDSEAYKTLLKGKQDRLLENIEPVFNFAQKEASWLKDPKNLNFDRVLNQAKAQIHYLQNVKETLSPEEKKILQALKGLKERISGLNGHYKPTYEAQAKLTAKLASEGVGPVGRVMALSGQYLQRIFNGETLGKPGKGWFANLMGPAMAGGFIFGMSFKRAHEAKEGEKTKTFFHDFFGTGVANFLGWELGKKWLNSSGIFHKVLGRFATKRPFDATRLGRHLPFFGERFGVKAEKLAEKLVGRNGWSNAAGLIMGKGLGGFFSRLTLGGLATELTAMFVFGSGMQWVGEKLAHVIFGKPSKESIEGLGSKKMGIPMNPMLQAQQGFGAAGPLAQMAPPAGTPQLMGYNAQPFQQAAGFPMQPNGLTGMPAASSLFGPGTAVNRPSQQRALPQFSLSPEQISHNAPAQEMQGMQTQILKSSQLKEQKNHGRTNYFDPNTF